MKSTISLDSKLIILILLVISLAGSIWYGLREKNRLTETLTLQEELLASKAIEFDQMIKEKDEAISVLTTEKTLLTEALTSEQNKNNEFEEQIKRISGKVGTLEKLSKTDPELLQKYSKVYFLNEHYVPPRLATISEQFTFDKSKTYEIHADVWPELKDLLETAKEDGIEIQVVSAYRSFGTQAALKSNYKVTYGAGTANQFSADQGYSEHQLGTTVDFTTLALGASFTPFDTTTAYTWLLENAHKYGFILSYPKGNAYYQYEPWHWRFVGVDLAKTLYNQKKNFYDLDQREIDSYLVDIFD